MSVIRYTPQSIKDIDRLAQFLRNSDPHAALDTAKIIVQGINILQTHPEVGRKVNKGHRELIISRGKSGYLALYLFQPASDTIRILAIRHQRESGYKSD